MEKHPQITCLKKGRLIDPSQGKDVCEDLWVMDGKIIPEPSPLPEEIHSIDLDGLIVCPGLIDMHVHLREPGAAAKETIASGSQAAAAGGFTSILAMPNTTPPADDPATITWMQERAKAHSPVNVFFTGCLSQSMQGELLAPMHSLKQAGAIALTDDGACIQSNEVMRRAMEYALMCGLPILDHCQDYSLTQKSVMNEGYWSTLLGLQGWPSVAEEIIVARNALLSELTGASVHCQHLSTKGSVRILREAKKRGVAIHGEAMPHHLSLTDACLEKYDTNFKMNPPLRTQSDQEALLEGIADRTITILASDHAPHCDYEKEVEFNNAPFGIVGLETSLAIFIKTLIEPNVIDWPRLIEMMTFSPAQFLALNKGTLQVGADADITVIDPNLEWTVCSKEFRSKSRNTPFEGWKLKGKAVKTFVSGKEVFSYRP